MDKKTKIFFWVISTLIAVVVVVTFSKYFILKDYYIVAEADCDPETQKCFIWNCDPESTEEGEACTGDPEADSWYYQVVNKKANLIPLCDPNNESCDALSCNVGEDCEVTYCDQDTVEEGIECNDPAAYLEEMSEAEAEEEANEEESSDEAVCEESDEECIAAEEESEEVGESDEVDDADVESDDSSSGEVDEEIIGE